MFDIWPAVYSVHVHMHVLGACEMLTGRYTLRLVLNTTRKILCDMFPCMTHVAVRKLAYKNFGS